MATFVLSFKGCVKVQIIFLYLIFKQSIGVEKNLKMCNTCCIYMMHIKKCKHLIVIGKMTQMLQKQAKGN